MFDVDNILVFSFELRSVEEYVSRHGSDKDKEAVYYVVFPNEVLIYHCFRDIVDLHEYLEIFGIFFKKWLLWKVRSVSI